MDITWECKQCINPHCKSIIHDTYKGRVLNNMSPPEGCVMTLEGDVKPRWVREKVNVKKDKNIDNNIPNCAICSWYTSSVIFDKTTLYQGICIAQGGKIANEAYLNAHCKILFNVKES